MRIVAGKFGSRPIKSVPGDHTRPTADKIKGAIFSRIGPYFEGGTMLDLFSGSGNMGLESLSRGMDHAVFCDHNHTSIRVIKENIHAMQAEAASTVWKCDYRQALQRCYGERQTFDLIFLDPPYALENKSDILKQISDYELLKSGGDLIFETAKTETLPMQVLDIKQVKSVEYGITRITYYQKEVNEDA